MAKKRRSLKKNHYKRDSQRFHKTLHRDVLTNNYVNYDFNKDDRMVRSQKQILSLWNKLFSVPRETTTKPNIILHSPLVNVMQKRKESVCKERHEKRRALFSIGKAGKGVAGPLKKVIGLKSKVRCK